MVQNNTINLQSIIKQLYKTFWNKCKKSYFRFWHWIYIYGKYIYNIYILQKIVIWLTELWIIAKQILSLSNVFFFFFFFFLYTKKKIVKVKLEQSVLSSEIFPYGHFLSHESKCVTDSWINFVTDIALLCKNVAAVF